MALMGLEIGGAETHVVELSKELKRQGFDLAVISNGGVYVQELEAAGIRHYQAPMHRRSPLLMLRSLMILRRVIRRERPDVVHAHARIPAFLCGILHRSMKFPFVTSAHWVFHTNGVLRLLTDWGQRTIAVSEDIKDYLMERYGIPAEQIAVTINGIDTEKFSPQVSGARVIAEFGLDASRPILSYVSRMDASRAMVARQLIEGAPRLAERVPGIQLLIAGGGDVFDELRAKADQINEQMGYPCITMTGARTDINEIVAAGQVFVGVSRAALEAMAAAKPVIVAGNEGYIGLFGRDKLDLAQESNFCCRGCPPSQTDTLIEDTARAFTLPQEEREALGAYGRQVIFDCYSVRRMASDCAAVYRQVWRPLDILVSGYYGFNNLGDEAILLSLRQRLRELDPDASITVLSKNPAQTQHRYGVHAVYRFSLPQVRRAVKRCDLLLSGGGSLLQDRTSTRSLIYYLAIIRLAKRYWKKVMLYANGIGPVTQPSNRRMMRRVLDLADVITLRDEDSREELLSMGVSRPPMTVTSDPVFTISGVPRDDALSALKQAGIPTDRPILGISVRQAFGMQERMADFARFFDQAARKFQCTPVFLIMQIPNDREISRQFQQMMEEPSYLFASPYDPETMMGVIGCMECVLSTRLHTLIFAAKRRVPLLGFVYDPKVESYLKLLGMPSGGAPQSFDCDAAMEALSTLMSHRQEAVEGLNQVVTQLEKMAQENERQLVQLLSGPS